MTFRPSRYVPAGRYRGVRLLRPHGKQTRKRALQLARAVTTVVAERTGERLLAVEYDDGPALYKIVKAPYYDAKKNQFFAKVLTNSGPRVVTCSQVDSDSKVCWAFAYAKTNDFEALLPRGWFV